MAGNVVLFATGSPVLVEVEESLLRASVKIAAGVRNRNGFDYLSDPALLVGAASVGVALTALPFLIPLFTPANRQAGFLLPFPAHRPDNDRAASVVYRGGRLC
jgi:hypothetical protein